jgi:adenosine deaminase
MRDAGRSLEIADLALAFRGAGVVGFDIAGPENGYPPSAHRAAFEHAHRAGLTVTVHAGEAFGVPSISEAVHVCRADRLGHGVRIVDDIADLHGAAQLGPLAGWVREHRIALEMCPTSNLQTGAASSIAAHPITRLRELGFRVTLNTDSRLVAGTSMTREMSLLVDQAGWTIEDLRTVTVNAVGSAFVPDAQRAALLADVVRPGFAPFTDDVPPV